MPLASPKRTRPAAPAVAAIAAVAAIGGAAVLLRGRPAEPPVDLAAAREAALRVDGAPRDAWGGPLRPAPLVSRGKPVAASRSGARALVDGKYRTGAWLGGDPAPGAPVWVAIRVGEGPSRVLLSWTSSYNHDYRDLFYGAPVDYRIDTSADSTDGKDGTWRTAVAVTGNPVRSRAHALDFAGQRWIRLVVTALAPERHRWGVALDEIDVHDLSLGGDDVWVFLGDSIGAGVFDRAPRHRPSFADDVARAHPGYVPAMIDAGFCRARTGEVLARIDEVLAWNPDARVYAITLGANDPDEATFGRDLAALVDRIRAAGKIAIVSRVPYQTKYGQDFVASKNRALDRVVTERGLLPGPDPYGWFRERPERLADGLHPDDAGSIAMSRLWAESVAPLYPR